MSAGTEIARRLSIVRSADQSNKASCKVTGIRTRTAFFTLYLKLSTNVSLAGRQIFVLGEWVVNAVAYSARKSDHVGMEQALTQQPTADLYAFGMAVRVARRALNLSQEELAHRASIDRSHMGRIERGERNVTFFNIIRIASALGMSPSNLLASAGL
jgi:DNA-binding XRE family transcriptional regulator